MRSKVTLLLILTSSALVLTTGCAHNKKIKTSWGTSVEAPKCIQQIEYSGNSFGIGKANIPLDSENVTIKGVAWNTTKLREVAPAIKAMEETNLQLCKTQSADMQTLTYDEFHAKYKKRETDQAKLNQLLLLAGVNNPESVNKWIDTYFEKRERTADDLSKTAKVNEMFGIEPGVKMIYNDAVPVQPIINFIK